MEGASQGLFDFAAVVLDGLTGDELFRWQNGTVGNDVIKFAQFDSVGQLYLGGFSSAAWAGGAGDEDVIAIKFERLSTSVEITEAPATSSPTAAPTLPSSPSPTPVPTAASRDLPLPSPAPTVSATPSSTSAVEVAEAGRDAASEAVLERWEVGTIAAAAGVFLVLLALCESFFGFYFGGKLCYYRGNGVAVSSGGCSCSLSSRTASLCLHVRRRPLDRNRGRWCGVVCYALPHFCRWSRAMSRSEQLRYIDHNGSHFAIKNKKMAW